MVRQRARRKTSWEDTIISLSTAAGAQSSLSLLANRAAVDLDGCTAVRTIFGFHIRTVTGTAHTQRVAIGVALVERDAQTAGIFPDPNAETDEPGWLWREIFLLQATAADIKTPDIRIEREIRAMRKMDAGHLFMIILNNDTIGGTGQSVLTDGMVRTLLKLP